MSSRRLPPEVYKNLKKLELSANTKSGTVEETITLVKPSEDEDPRPNYWFILMLSFGQRSGYVYDRTGLHIPEPDVYVYSIELWKLINKVDFDNALKALDKLKNELLAEGFKILQ
ncbi:MAG: hypothetical protein ACTSP3_09155 [Candidatus Heimdallarchaeaceae archaeon]